MLIRRRRHRRRGQEAGAQMTSIGEVDTGAQTAEKRQSLCSCYWIAMGNYWQMMRPMMTMVLRATGNFSAIEDPMHSLRTLFVMHVDVSGN